MVNSLSSDKPIDQFQWISSNLAAAGGRDLAVPGIFVPWHALAKRLGQDSERGGNPQEGLAVFLVEHPIEIPLK